jgi:signal transduction histidine kinase
MELLGRAAGQMDDAAHVRLGEMVGRVKQLSSDVHRISYQLHPAKVDQLGLVTAARTLCRELSSQSGVQIQFAHGDIPRDLDANLALCLYRVLQEALQNSIRHSGVKAARAELRLDGEQIHLTIADAGKGFDLAHAVRHGGLGLISIRERIRQVRGTLTLDSSPDTGTRVEVRARLRPPTELGQRENHG